jgi:putative aldouronate transport system permease protein
VLTLVLLAVGRIFYGDFGLVLNLVKSNALLYRTTDVIDTYVFRSFRWTGGNFASGSAAGLYQSVTGFVVILLANGIVRRVDRERALF